MSGHSIQPETWTAAKPESVDLKTAPLSVLVLDDEENVRETLCAMIKSIGLRVESAQTADGFFAKLAEDYFDVVIIDLIMPDCDGLEVLNKLVQLDHGDVILASGSGERVLQATKLSAETSGISILGTLPKPFRRQHLKNLLAQAKPCAEGPPAMKSPLQRQEIDETLLHDAILNRDIVCHLQPKIRLSDGRPYGFEALARWNDPKHGMIFPDQFIPLASASGLDFELTLSILDQAMECLASLSDTSLTVSVNVPVKICANPKFESKLNALLEHHGLTSRHVILEVTEAGPNGMTQDEIDSLLRLRMKGHHLSIDDFGTGASSLERLVRIPFDELKIDRLFARNVDKSRSARNLIRTLVQMARLFDMSVTIEGVETENAIKISSKLGCDNAQGYGVARPMHPSAVKEWMMKRAEAITAQAGIKVC